MPPAKATIVNFNSALVRFRKRLTYQSNGCVTWSSVRKDGYGTFTVNGKCHVPHKWLYELVIAPVPEGWTLDHLCRNRGCVRLDHLEAVPHKENIRRAFNHMSQQNAAKTHCPRGHAYTADNVWIQKRNSTVMRKCKQCDRQRKLEKKCSK